MLMYVRIYTICSGMEEAEIEVISFAKNRS